MPWRRAPGWELTAHILLSMGAAALLFAAAVTALLLVCTRTGGCARRRIADLPTVLPPLDALEKVMFRLIGAGFALLTLALLTGFIFVTNLLAQHLEHKTILSLIAWVLFGVLLIGAHPLRLARALRRALDLVRLRLPGPVVFRLEIRPRVSARAALGLSARERMAHLSLGVIVLRTRRVAAPGRLLRRQRNRSHEPESLPAAAPGQGRAIAARGWRRPCSPTRTG